MFGITMSIVFDHYLLTKFLIHGWPVVLTKCCIGIQILVLLVQHCTLWQIGQKISFFKQFWSTVFCLVFKVAFCCCWPFIWAQFCKNWLDGISSFIVGIDWDDFGGVILTISQIFGVSPSSVHIWFLFGIEIDLNTLVEAGILAFSDGIFWWRFLMVSSD